MEILAQIDALLKRHFSNPATWYGAFFFALVFLVAAAV